MAQSFTTDDQQTKQIRHEGEPNCRTIYLGGVGECTLADIMDSIVGGIIDNVRTLPRKHCAFVTFLLPEAAHAFYQKAKQTPLLINGYKVNVGWGDSKPLSPQIDKAVQNGATRNVFVGGSVDERTTEDWFQGAFSRFGAIDCVDVLANKRIAFVHFGSIESAVNCVTTLTQDPQWQPFRLAYGKDRCVNGRKSRGPSKMPYMNQRTNYPGSFGMNGHGFGMGGNGFPPSAGFGPGRPGGYGPRNMYGPGGMRGDNRYAPGMGPGGYRQAGPGMGPMDFIGPMYGAISPNSNSLNRTIYLGGFTEELTLRDLCDQVRGGLLDNVKTLPEKKCAFVTFIDHRAANMFFQRAQLSNGEYVVKGKRLKVGWGKSKPLSPDICAAIARGATRNVFLGNIDETITEERLGGDLAQFGTIEKINVIPAKKIAFINFTSIIDAITCVNALRSEDSHLHAAGYGNYRANYGKDRCAGDQRGGFPPRSMPPGGQPMYPSNYQLCFQGGRAGSGNYAKTESRSGKPHVSL